ncbi:MAG: FAD-dependent oxidoreductase [Actinomycetota bacterium]
MNQRSIDVAVLGGGAAGLAAVREARRRGASALLINDGPLGGDCTFTGCVPSKTLIESARRGLGFDEAFARVRSVVAAVAEAENAEVLRGEGVEVVEAEGTLVGPGRLRADGIEWTAKGVVLAIGGRPAVPPIPGLAAAEPLTSDTLWELAAAPARLAVIGGGAIGCELGQALATLGVAVTVVEMAPRLLPGEESAASNVVTRALTAAGVDVRTGVGVASVDRGPGVAAPGTEAVLRLDDGSTVVCDRIVVAAGRTPNSDRAGLVEAGVMLDERGHVAAGDDLATNLSRTWVAGDLSGKAALTHAADHMGRLAAGNVLRRIGRGRFRAEEIPRVTFTDPEVASVGMSEAEAAARWGERARVAELPLSEHDRALSAGSIDGYLKIVAGPKAPTGTLGGGRVVGATVVAERAGEVLAELTLALRLRTHIGRVALTVHPYPTWSYGVPKAMAQFFTTVEGRTARPARPTP